MANNVFNLQQKSLDSMVIRSSFVYQKDKILNLDSNKSWLYMFKLYLKLEKSNLICKLKPHLYIDDEKRCFWKRNAWNTITSNKKNKKLRSDDEIIE